MIFKEYISTNNLIIIYLPFALVFTAIETNKEYVTNILEKSKASLINSNDYSNIKVVVNKISDKKTYTILKGVDFDNLLIDEFHKYEINGDNIIGGEYGNKIVFVDSTLMTNNFTRYENNQIKNINEKNVILFNLNKFTGDKLIYDETINERYLNFSIYKLNKIIFLILFFYCIFFILFNKNLIDKKQNFFFPVIITFVLFFYVMTINIIEVSIYNFEFKILALILTLTVFYKFYKYE